jgi:hypothetical protein
MFRDRLGLSPVWKEQEADYRVRQDSAENIV